MNLYPKFITFEGGEGSGKTTQVGKLYDYLKSQNIPVIITREVGGCPSAEKIRDLFLSIEMFSISELLLVIAARYEHMKNVVIPALKKGSWVICDRFVDSTATYQGNSPDIGQDLVYELHKKIIGPLFFDIGRNDLPDITFFMDIEAESGLKRTKNRLDNNRFENKKLLFHKQIYDSFCKLSIRFKDRIIPIKISDKTPDEIHELIKKNL